ncbi:GTP-binding and nucleic acid-binding protein YchF [Acholeplasma hippikon]|uniref:Ribosome-binding ATPase YchF n=2 Tax=Acholeplasma hippikon TaxID=264636 RepID=A0A449BIV1_9MOLU|nr:redox-regulated ATPase YchF [Acholeplasma hippikon]VEU82386.1 GTP-binding and nucleic acid-binding protein YchF [Acholeplasma hippikon]
MLSIGIVGLPNVGKSTLFNAITNSGVLAANYPFATIDPNVGVVQVNDDRLENLAKIYKSAKIIPTAIEFIDIAGLVKGASKGEGLGNQFLSHIRQVDAIAHVIRCFEDTNITHVEGRVDPIRDLEIIEMELRLADLESIEKRLPRLEKMLKVKNAEAMVEASALTKVKTMIETDGRPSDLDFSDEEKKIVKNLNLLSLKQNLYIANLADTDLANPTANNHFNALVEKGKSLGIDVIPISAQVEYEISTIEDKEEQTIFLESYGLKESGLDSVIKKGYEILGLKTYFTCGPQETRAWTFVAGTKAPQAAGIIHTDFEKGFIKAETLSYDDLMACGSPVAAKEKGKVRLEGKDYVVQDGDIMHFRFNV